jgi:enterochelin esterase-like enzyme
MWLTVLFVVIAVTATVLLWPRLAGPGPARVSGRVGLIVASQLFAAVMSLIIVNKTLGPFFVTWQDLFGQDVGSISQTPSQQAGGPTPAGGGNQAPTGRTGTQEFKPGKGGFKTTEFAGPKSGIKDEVDVFTPPQYDDPAWKDKEFPVVVLFHGIPGTNSGWYGDGALAVAKQVEPLMKNGKLQPMILVIPSIGNQSTNTNCSDVPGKGNRATWLAEDVRAMVVDNFRAAKDPKRWAGLGYSTGGFCGPKLAVQYPQSFHFGMGIAADNFHGDPSAIGDKELRQKNSPLWMLENAKPAPDVKLWLMTSKEDQVGKTSYSEELVAAAQRAGVPAQSFTVPKGGHLTAVWKQLIVPAFEWVNAEFPKP